MKGSLFRLLILFLFTVSCNSSHSNDSESAPAAAPFQSQPVYNPPVYNPPAYTPHPRNDVPNYTTHRSYSRSGGDCGIADGTYRSDVDYYNPKTRYTASYTLDVVVSDCEVVEIDFPKGGWLDSDHIDATAIDDDGTAEVKDDRGCTFEVHIDKANMDREGVREDDDQISTEEPEKDESENEDPN